jgi:hypothetical protein
MILRRTCKQAAALLIARQDRPLAWSDRLALYLHLAACHACPRFDAQLQLMREGFRRWRQQPGAGDPADAAPPSRHG